MSSISASLNRTSHPSLTRARPRWLLRVLRIAGFIIPVIPLWRTIRDQNKRFYTFVERPLMGIPSDFLGTTAARAIASALLGSTNPVGFWRNFAETYFSYQSANLVRNGVNVDDRLKDKVKVRLNYWYSVVIYSLFTAADKFAKVNNPAATVTAVAEVGYAMLWPLMSQHAATYIVTPVMFGRFAKKDFIDKMRSANVSVSAMQAELEAEMQSLDALIVRDPSDVSSRRAKFEVRWKMRWVTFFRKELADDQPTPMRRFIAYWIIKTAVSVGISAVMITLYFTMRFSLVGFGDYSGPLSRLVQLASQELVR